MRIVIIDDQRLNIALLEASLATEPGVEVRGFERGEEAVAHIRAVGADLVFVDYDMPGMDGLQVVAALRAEASLDDMPVVMVSGIEAREVRLKALTLGATDFLAKPVDPIDLRARTANMLRLRRRSLDLTEARARAEATLAELRTAQDRLVESEKLAALGRLVAGVAHEINTPLGNALTTVTGTAGHLARLTQTMGTGSLRRGELEDFLAEATEMTELSRSNIERAARIVQAFKQITDDGPSDPAQPFRLADHLLDLTTRFRAEVEARGHSLHLHCAEGVVVTAAAGALARGLEQGLRNALDHGWRDGRAGVLSLTVAPQADGWTALHLADDGNGMDAATQARAFEPFFTTARARGHIGLGLAMVANLVRRPLGGTVALESRPGHGTTLTITLPPAPPDSL